MGTASIPRGSRLLVDTNIVIDFLGHREPHHQAARLLMAAGKLREFQLWVSSSQVTDVLYVLSNGGKPALMPQVKAAVEGLLDFISVYSTGEGEVRSALASGWLDPEDALIHEVALALQAKAIITRNKADFEESLIPVYDCEEFFDALRKDGIDYEELELA